MGAKPGRTKGNEQKAEYRNRERKHGKPGFERTGKAKEARAEPGTGKATVRQGREEKERKNRRLSSRNRKRSGRKKADRKGKDRKRKHKVST